MKQFPTTISFRYPWRSYQKRVLDGLEEHLKNHHLHLVAPPGSGKTVLGLEVMLRVNKPTFIVAPTLTIKNQWADRFVELFLQTDQKPDWVSTNIKEPAFVTITTYQSLHSLYKQMEQDSDADEQTEETAVANDSAENIEHVHEANRVKEAIKRIGFQTLILDEAHHLRTAWWRSALQFRNELEQPTIVALTATPPYDVQHREWQRYIELCGPIDAEISVPELVREGELCPHQDYVYLSAPSSEESALLRTFRQDVKELSRELVQHEALLRTVSTHPWISSTADHLEEILATPSYYSSMVVYLKAADHPLWHEAAAVLGVEKEAVPTFDEEWLEELLTGLLYTDRYVDQTHQELTELRKRLSRMGAIERRKVYLRSTPGFDRMLTHSSSKLQSIKSVVDFEYSLLRDRLRMVILTDYIRRDDLPKQEGDEKPLTRLGVIPIFELIRRYKGNELPTGILTGSLVILPTTAVEMVRKRAEEEGLSLSFQSLAHDANYVTIEVRDANRSSIVSVITDVFAQGGVQLLIGTAALLGEGWDAPSINSLIMASYVGSYMLSNQMRGRAIRTEKGNPDKSAAIWHLACLDVEQWNGGQDLQALSRRFRSLVGLSTVSDTIESGIKRMNIQTHNRFTLKMIEQKNLETFDRARQRDRLRDRWNTAISLHGGMTEELVSDKKQVPKPFVYRDTVKAVFTFSAFLGIIWFSEILTHPQLMLADIPFWLKLLIAVAISGLVSGPWLLKALKLQMMHHSLESSLKQVGMVVYRSLHEMGLLGPEPSPYRVKVEEQRDGSVVCWLNGGTTQEKTLFLNALQQVLDPIENPRYLLYRETRSFFYNKRDYHALPDEIARNKKQAERFLQLWQKKIGPAELVYTRTTEGRKVLLTARTRAMSAAFVPKADRISAWR